MKSLEQFKEGYVSTADYKLDKRGRKIKKRKFKLGGKSKASFDEKTGEYKLKEARMDVPFVPDPPVVLVIKRRAVRLYPDGTRIALYWSDKLKRYFSVPYGTQMDNPIQAEEYIKELTEMEELVLNDGNVIKLNEQTKEKIIGTYNQLDEENKSVFWAQLTESVSTFGQLYEFCRTNSSK